MSKNQHFQIGSGIYTCYRCKNQTRETGQGEAQFDLCAACFEIEGMENQHSDDGHDGELKNCQECLSQMSKNAIAKL